MIILALFVMTTVVVNASAFDQAAVNLTKGGDQAYGEGTETDLPILVGSIVNVFLAVLGIVLTIIIIRGGFMYMLAGGDPNQTQKAKSWIINGVIGLIIILAAYAISSFVVSSLVEAGK